MKNLFKGAVVSSMVVIGTVGAIGTIQIQNETTTSSVIYGENSWLLTPDTDSTTTEVAESNVTFDSKDISVTMLDGSQDMFSDSETQQMRIYVNPTKGATITKVEYTFYRDELPVDSGEAFQDSTKNSWNALIHKMTNADTLKIVATQDIGDASGIFTAENSFEFTYYPDGLSGGAIAGIVIGSLVVVGLIAGEGYRFYTTKKQRNRFIY